MPAVMEFTLWQCWETSSSVFRARAVGCFSLGCLKQKNLPLRPNMSKLCGVGVQLTAGHSCLPPAIVWLHLTLACFRCLLELQAANLMWEEDD